MMTADTLRARVSMAASQAPAPSPSRGSAPTVAIPSPLTALRAFTEESREWRTQNGFYCLMRCDAGLYPQQRGSELVSVMHMPTSAGGDSQDVSVTVPGAPVVSNGHVVFTGVRDVEPEQVGSLAAWVHAAGFGDSIARTDRLSRAIGAASLSERHLYHNDTQARVTALLVSTSIVQGGHPADYCTYLQRCALADPINGISEGLAKLEEVSMRGNYTEASVLPELDAHVAEVEKAGLRTFREGLGECVHTMLERSDKLNTIPEKSEAFVALQQVFESALIDGLSEQSARDVAGIEGYFNVGPFQGHVVDRIMATEGDKVNKAAVQAAVKEASSQMGDVYSTMRYVVAPSGSEGARCGALYETASPLSHRDRLDLAGKLIRESLHEGTGFVASLQSIASKSSLGLKPSQAVLARAQHEQERRASLRGERGEGITR